MIAFVERAHIVTVRHIIIPVPQILALHIRIIALRIIAVHVVVLRLPKRKVSIRIIPVRLPDIPLLSVTPVTLLLGS